MPVFKTYFCLMRKLLIAYFVLKLRHMNQMMENHDGKRQVYLTLAKENCALVFAFNLQSFIRIIVLFKVTEGIPFPFAEWTLHYATTTANNATTNKQTSSRLFFLVASQARRAAMRFKFKTVRWCRIISVTRTTGWLMLQQIVFHSWNVGNASL